MIGFYDYTVILTYLSLISASTGIFVALSGKGHPYLGMVFLLICGVCDAFDGKVARTKKNRTERHKKFGIQIDSLSDIVAFGILPAAIGASLIKLCPDLKETVFDKDAGFGGNLLVGALFGVLVVYILAALIRLAYFNVDEEDRQSVEADNRKTYLGLPVTSSSLIFPTIILIFYIIEGRYEGSITLILVYCAAALLVGLAFITPFKLKKPGLRGILIMVGIGAVEFVLFLIFMSVYKKM